MASQLCYRESPSYFDDPLTLRRIAIDGLTVSIEVMDPRQLLNPKAFAKEKAKAAKKTPNYGTLCSATTFIAKPCFTSLEHSRVHEITRSHMKSAARQMIMCQVPQPEHCRR